MSDRPNTDPPTKADHAETAGDADTVDQQEASDLGNHLEAKSTPGNSSEESVTWTEAFSSVPVVTTGNLQSVSPQAQSVSSRSKTGATLYTENPIVQMAIALEDS